MRARRGCLTALAGGAALLLLGAVAAYRAIDPEALRTLAERQATIALGEPVAIGRMHVSVWPAPAVTGTDVRVHSSGAPQAPGLSVRAIRILPQWRTLLSRPVVVDAVEIEGLTVSARRDRERRWILPGSAAPPAPDPGAPGGAAGPHGAPAPEAIAVRRVRVRDGRVVVIDDVLRAGDGSPEVAVITVAEADLVQRPDGARTLSMRGAIGTSPLAGTVETNPQAISASVTSPSLRTADLPALFALLGSSPLAGFAVSGDAPLELTLRVAHDTGALTASGRLRAARVQFDTLAVTDVAAPFRVADDAIVVEPLTMSAYGGTGRGTLAVRFERAPAAWTLNLRLQGLDVNALLSANTTARDRVLGTGTIAAHVTGTTEAPAARHMNGTVDVVLSNGTIRNFALLAAINRALHLTGGDRTDTRFERLAARLALTLGSIRVDDASLAAGELTATAAGTIAENRSINMSGTAVFSREASARMIASVKEISGARNGSGKVEVPFRITGSVAEPAFAIDAEQILGRAIRKEVERSIRKGLDRLLRRR